MNWDLKDFSINTMILALKFPFKIQIIYKFNKSKFRWGRPDGVAQKKSHEKYQTINFINIQKHEL